MRALIKKLLFGILCPAYYALMCRLHPVTGKVLLLELRFGRLSDNLAPYYRYYKKQPEGVSVLCVDCENRTGLRLATAYMKMFSEISSAGTVYVTESSRVLAAVKIRKETKLIQVWHACGAFKRFGYGLPDAPEEAYYSAYDLVPVSGKRVEEVYADSMHQKAEAVSALGVARTDIYFNKKFLAAAEKTVADAFPEAAGRRIILFAPTFRGNVAAPKMPHVPDIAALHEAWGDSCIVLYKGHPAVKEKPHVPAGCGDFFQVVPDGIPTERLIAAADILLTDYSSVIFDFSLFGRPMLFYCYDLEEYDDGRGFYYPFRDFVPGAVCTNTDELAAAGRRILDGDHDARKVKAFREDFMGACDGHALERIVKTVG